MRFCYIFAIIMSSLLTLPIQAQSAPPQARSELISIDVRDKPFSDIIEGIREQTNKNIIYDDEIKDVYVTIKLVQLPWLMVLNTIAKRHNCLVEELDLQVIKVSKPAVVRMEFSGADIRDVIDQIAGLANKNIIISEAVKGPVNLRLHDVAWRDALNAIVKNSGYVIVEENNILRVVRPEDIETQTETAIFKLRYIRPKSPFVAQMQTNFLRQENTEIGEGTGVQLSNFSLLNALQTVITANKGKITYDSGTNTLVITDTKPKLDKMAEIIKQLDKEPKQIFIDVKFVQTQNSDVFNFGLGFGDTGIEITHTFPDLLSRLPFTNGDSGFEDVIAFATDAQRDEGIPNDANIEALQANGGPINEVGQLDFKNTQFVFKLFKQDVKTKVIQAPKLITLDHHEATIFVGDTISFAKTEFVENDNGNLSVQLVEADDSPVTEGFQLLVVPHVIPDTNKVQLTVVLSNTLLSGQDDNAGIAGFNLFAAGDVEILLPQLTEQVVVTHMILESTQTAIVGGLLQITETENVNKVPFLGDLPMLGYFFKRKDINKQKDDLFIFITPRIVESAQNTQQKLRVDINDYRKRDEQKFNNIWGGGNK
ncbi:secretin N-terminal domain-containing protein [Candidatus Uabimicrobium sp. HlEnr_7]|uniref:secretin N-terminal domain-containing protein n=1 Tax=Candidatus Uabimicrobium helgolandensis TaxID=3095367 RepID=UPI0035575912